MRNYDNMPVLDWSDDRAALRAKAQILHQEPVILQMSDSFDTRLDADACGGDAQGASGVVYDCDGGEVLRHLATQNGLQDLDTVAEACAESGSRVDVDSARKRIIVHD